MHSADNPDPQRRRLLGIGSQAWIGLLFSLACLFLAIYDIKLGQVLTTLRTTNLSWVLVGVLLVVSSIVAKALRWRYLLQVDHKTDNELADRSAGYPLGLARLTNIWLAGAALNLALPTPRSGDLARAYLAGEAGDTSKSLVLGTVAAEKLLDMVMLALCFVVLVPLVALPEELAARQGPVVGLSLMLVAVVFVVLWQRNWILGWAWWLLGRFPSRWSGPLQGSTERAVQGLDALRRPRILIRLVLISVVIWLLATAVNYVVFLALALPASWIESLFVLVVLQAGVALPTTPGKVGVFQVLCRWALGVLGYPAAVGLSYGIVLYLVAPVTHMLLGAVALLWESWQLRKTPGSLASLLTYREEAPVDSL